MPDMYDVVIIGAGPGGYATALRAAQLGLSVALVERDSTLGGTCLNRGCIPSKALLTAVHAIDTAQHARGIGPMIEVNGFDYAALGDYRRRMVNTMVNGLTGLVAQRGITVFRGEASITPAPSNSSGGNGSDNSCGTDSTDGCSTNARHTVHISPAPDCSTVIRTEGSNKPTAIGETCDLTARHVVLATGSTPRTMPETPFHGAVIDSTQALELSAFPSSAVIIGSGAIALEFASIWSRGGCKTTLLIRKDRVLSGWDRRVSSAMTRELARAGITVVTRSQVTNIWTGECNAAAHSDENSVSLASSMSSASSDAVVRYMRDGEEHDISAQVVLVAIGRAPVTNAAWMDEIGLSRDERGYVITDQLGQTSIPDVWAVGDITAGHTLAHRAFEQGIVVAESIAGLDPHPVDEMTVPQIVFSIPQAASVGLTLEQARDRDDIVNARQTAYPMAGNARMVMDGANGALSVVTGAYTSKPDVDVVLGVHMVAPDASDLIAEAQQLVGNRVPLTDAARLIHPHPTFSETIGEALLKADGRPLHTR